MTAIERRKSARIETRSKAIIKAEDRTLEVTLVDISNHGAGCLVDKNIAVVLNQPIELTLFDTQQSSFTVSAVILHGFSFDSKHNKLGLQFENVTDEQKQCIQDFVYQLLSATGGERRQSPRITTRIAMQALPKDKALAVLENISMGGLSIVCKQFLSVNDPIDIQLPLNEENDVLSCTGKVIHVKEMVQGSEYKVGVEFNNIPPHIKKQIHHWIMNLLQNPQQDVTPTDDENYDVF